MSTDELEKLLADATPLPWRQGQPDSRKVHPHWRDSDGNDRDDCLHKNGWAKTIATVGKEEGDWRDALRQHADAALIVAAVNALPELLERLERLEEAFSGPAAWLDRWAQHVGNCKGSDVCTCGLTFVRAEAAAALNQEPGQ